MSGRAVVYAFPKPGWVDTVSCDGKPCGSGGGCGSSPATTTAGNCRSEGCGDSTSCDFATMLTRLAERHPDLVELKVADYSSLGSILRSLDDLNQVLDANGEDLRVSLENLDLVFSQIAPIVAVNNTLAFVGKEPTEEELLAAALALSGARPN